VFRFWVPSSHLSYSLSLFVLLHLLFCDSFLLTTPLQIPFPPHHQFHTLQHSNSFLISLDVIILISLVRFVRSSFDLDSLVVYTCFPKNHNHTRSGVGGGERREPDASGRVEENDPITLIALKGSALLWLASYVEARKAKTGCSRKVGVVAVR